jgi:hypothetical protein
MKSGSIFRSALIAVLLFAAPTIAQAHLRNAVASPLGQAVLLVNREDFKGALAEVDKAATVPNQTVGEQKTIQDFRNILRANITEPVANSSPRPPTSSGLRCAAPQAATPQQAIATYKRLVAIEEPGRIRILRRGNSWLVFQGTFMVKFGESSYGYVGVPMDGAHHLAKVSMCDGSVLPDNDLQP